MRFEVPSLEGAAIAVAGDVMLDRYWYGDSSRVSAEAPIPIVKVDAAEDRPGGAANVALNIAGFGARVSLAGLIGADEAGGVLKDRLASGGVSHLLSEVPGTPTIVKLRVVSRHQQMLRMDFEQRFAREHAAAVTPAVETALADAKVLVLSDYGKGTLAHVQELIAAARRRGTPVLVDPKGTDFGRYRGATLLTPNLAEFEAVVGPCASEADLLARAERLLAATEVEALLVTRGAEGMTLFARGQGSRHFPARAKEVFDVTGAGDTVIATVAAALAAGESLPQAVALSNLAAGLAVGHLGTTVIGSAELRRAAARENGTDGGILDEETLLAAVADARAAGERIVFTNGCFDILHAGHVAYLKQARELGDRLVLALNGDGSVRRLKGEGRPVNPLVARMAVASALACVDWVVSFDTDTPIPLIEKLRPEVLVKGGDYALHEVIGADVVRAYGGEVRVLAHVEGASTTSLLQRITARG